MTKILFNDTTCCEMYTLNLTDDQMRLLEWLEEREYLMDIDIIRLDDDKEFQKI